MKILKELLYTKQHEWVRIEEDKAYIGITDYAQKALGAIVYVELPELDTEFAQGDAFAVIESVKAASDVYLPLGGKVIEINEEIVDDPALVNTDSYANWMVCIEIEDVNQIDELMKPEAYEEFCIVEANKH
jgi:glycine cleavage system H protein